MVAVIAFAYTPYCALLLLLLLVVGVLIDRRRDRRFRLHLCPGCGYDLRATRADHCPECGAKINVSMEARQKSASED
jgi:predicted amidophosphoribosyltransferase